MLNARNLGVNFDDNKNFDISIFLRFVVAIIIYRYLRPINRYMPPMERRLVARKVCWLNARTYV